VARPRPKSPSARFIAEDSFAAWVTNPSTCRFEALTAAVNAAGKSSLAAGDLDALARGQAEHLVIFRRWRWRGSLWRLPRPDPLINHGRGEQWPGSVSNSYDERLAAWPLSGWRPC